MMRDRAKPCPITSARAACGQRRRETWLVETRPGHSHVERTGQWV